MFDLVAVFTDPDKAIDLVPLLLKAGIDPTSIEYMDNTYVRTTADYCEYKNVPHYEDGIYVIVTVETYNEDELDMKMERLDELCTEAGAVEVLKQTNASGKCAAIARKACVLSASYPLRTTLLCRAIKLPMRLNLL